MAALTYALDEEGYSVEFPIEGRGAETKGGFGRLRADLTDAVCFVSCNWTFPKASYDAFMIFYETNKAISFTIDLVVNTGVPVTHSAYFVPGSLALSGVIGSNYVVSAMLEVTQIAAVEATDNATVAAYEAAHP